MKSVFLFCSKLWVYLTEIPVLILLWIAISYNDMSEDVFKYYPLIIFLCAAVIFILVYFFRVISISTDEIRYHGVFSSKDSAFISENKTLVMSACKRKMLRLELFGDAGEEPAFEWMRSEDVVHRDICLFRGKAIGGIGSICRVLAYFDVPKDVRDNIRDGECAYEDERIALSCERVNDIIKVSLKFKITII